VSRLERAPSLSLAALRSISLEVISRLCLVSSRPRSAGGGVAIREVVASDGTFESIMTRFDDEVMGTDILE
jgi:hypothetical protein